MATTTNYSFPTPDDTDLVKDGASAIRSFGTAVDTQIKNLSPGTTAGDIDYYTTSTAKARVGIGTAGQVLQVNSGATAPEWATPSSGGMTLISTTTLSGASITLSSIPSTYKNLQLVVRNFKPATGGSFLRIRLNSDTGTRYRGITTEIAQNSGSPAGTFINSSVAIGWNNDNSVDTGLSVTNIYDYANAVTWKMIDMRSISVSNANTDEFFAYNGVGYYNQTGAITDLVLFPSAGNFTSGTALLYGVK